MSNYHKSIITHFMNALTSVKFYTSIWPSANFCADHRIKKTATTAATKHFSHILTTEIYRDIELYRFVVDSNWYWTCSLFTSAQIDLHWRAVGSSRSSDQAATPQFVCCACSIIEGTYDSLRPGLKSYLLLKFLNKWHCYRSMTFFINRLVLPTDARFGHIECR